jgi:5-methylcytosine-specific restriction endonuclease McrA
MSGSWQWPAGWRRIRAEVFRVKGRQCWRCGAYANSVDHIIPVVLGGGHDLTNLRPACSSCNSSTGASIGNRLRPRRPLTARQRQAIAVKRAEAGVSARVLRSSRDW